jgi:site-specific recombinase XerC
LRHSVAVGWLANKGDVVSLSRTLGHTRLETTQAYLKDFQSREARLYHDDFSPVEVHRLGRQGAKRESQTKR